MTGLRAAVSAAVGYGLAAVEHGPASTPPVPPVLPLQARLAARNDVGLDVVLRRYLAGYLLLNDIVIKEVDVDPRLRGAPLRWLLRDQAALFDRLVATITEEYSREARSGGASSSEERRLERVERLLAGEIVDTSALEYGIDGHHVGLVASDAISTKAIRSAATALDCPPAPRPPWRGGRLDLARFAPRAQSRGSRHPTSLDLAAQHLPLSR